MWSSPRFCLRPIAILILCLPNDIPEESHLPLFDGDIVLRPAVEEIKMHLLGLCKGLRNFN